MRFLILILLACGHPDAPAREPVQPQLSDASVDASLDAATDASARGPADALVDALVSVDQPSPPLLVGKVIAVTVDSSRSVLTVDVGKRKGIDKHWRAALLDDNSRRVEQLELVSVSETTCRVRSKLSSDVVRKYHRVAFEP